MQASDLIATGLGADKVDIFLYDSTRESLNAICSSAQPLSALQRKLGLERLPIESEDSDWGSVGKTHYRSFSLA